MHKAHVKNTIRYYIVIIAFLVFLFFSNDFGLLDVQKTAIITAAGIDREGDTFIVTSQLAIPQSSSQGKQTQSPHPHPRRKAKHNRPNICDEQQYTQSIPDEFFQKNCLLNYVKFLTIQKCFHYTER